MTGKTVVIAVQTRAEVLTFPVMGQFGARRTTQIRAQVDQTPTVPVTDEVVQAWVQLTAACKRINQCDGLGAAGTFEHSGGPGGGGVLPAAGAAFG